GLWLILASARASSASVKVVLAALLIIVFSDVGYTAYFNSLYSEPTAMVFFLIALGSALVLVTKQSVSARRLLLYFVATAVLITSKPMYVPLAPGLLTIGVYLSGRIHHRRRYWLGAGLGVCLCLVCAGYYYRISTSVSTSLMMTSVYEGIFWDLLPN